MSILIPYPQLSENQKEFVNFCTNTNESIFLEGPPWSGKSLTCLYSLRDIVEKEKISALFMVSNNAMYGYMSIALKELGVSEQVNIQRKNRFFWKMAGDNRLSVSLNSDYNENYESILTNLLEEEIDEKYSLVVVNEVQDYLLKEWELIKRISQRIICYGDFKQAIYNNKVERDIIINDCVHKQLNYVHKGRSTDKLIKIRNYFLNDSEYNETKTDSYFTLPKDEKTDSKGDGYSFINVGYEYEFKAIANKIKELEKENSRVAIICPNNNRFTELSIYLENYDIEHKYYAINQDLRKHDFTSTIPLFISVFNAEGLQFDNVILFGFDDSNYIIEMKRKENKLRNILYVGMTRARNTTYIIATENTVKELKDFKREM